MREHGNSGKEQISQTEKKEIVKGACNKCGRRIRTERGMLREGVFFCEQAWDYFSGKDGEIHSFCLCESCYDEITETFKIPPARKIQTELI